MGVVIEKYERAQERIRLNLWAVDAEAGVVSNASGRRIGSVMANGYIFLSMSPADGGKSNQNVYAHRVIWESEHGQIPDGMQVNHINGNKADNRIANLELLTASGNIQHAVDTGLMTHLHGEDSPRSKVTARVVDSIRTRYAAGETQQAIADSVGLSRQQVSRIVLGTRWASTFAA